MIYTPAYHIMFLSYFQSGWMFLLHSHSLLSLWFRNKKKNLIKLLDVLQLDMTLLNVWVIVRPKVNCFKPRDSWIWNPVAKNYKGNSILPVMTERIYLDNLGLVKSFQMFGSSLLCFVWSFTFYCYLCLLGGLPYQMTFMSFNSNSTGATIWAGTASPSKGHNLVGLVLLSL